ncbi:hypothetical protein ACI3E1_07420 [Ligilactobacillus sp. LYQ139]
MAVLSRLTKRLSSKNAITTYLTKKNVSHNDIHSVLSNMTPNQHNMYDDDFCH